MGIELLDVDIGNVRAIPANGPRDSIVEANKEERTAKPTDTADVELAGNHQVGLIILKAIIPRHVCVLDVDNTAVRGSGGRNGPLVGAESKLVGFLTDFLQRSVNAIKTQIIASFQRFNVFCRNEINPCRDL